MFERFTDRARRVVVLAQEEARQLGHRHVGSEHLIAAMIREEDGVAGQVLIKDFDLGLAGVRVKIVELGAVGGDVVQGHVPFTPRVKKIIDLSLRESLQMGHNYIGTEHLLLALLREGEGTGCKLLREHIAASGLDDDLNVIRKAIIRHLGYEKPTPPADVPQPRTVGTATCGDACAKWGPEIIEKGEPPQDIIIAWAPITAVDELVALVTGIRDEIGTLNEARQLLQKYGYTVTPPVLPDVEQA